MKTKIKQAKKFIVRYPTQPAEWVFIMPELREHQPFDYRPNVLNRIITKLGL
ncbi:MAG: hypothetical protein PHH01_04880 [Patescibacteria group bacterium]|nr:hypothetical protein [Patescibacteria group bacterium]MDD5567501.1 hypothetical protein [Patescibacteria group bacterium]